MVKWILVVMVICLCGCQELMAPVSEEPNAPLIVDVAKDASAGIGALLTPFWPPAGIVLSAVAGLFAGYKRLQPKLKEAKDEGDKYFAAGQTLATVLEEVKQNQPELWKVIGPKITEATKATNDIGQAIDGFRGKA